MYEPDTAVTYIDELEDGERKNKMLQSLKNTRLLMDQEHSVK